MSSKNFTVGEIQSWCQDQAKLMTDRGYFNVAVLVEIRESERFSVTHVGYTAANFNGDSVVQSQFMDCLTEFDQQLVDKKFIDIEEAKRRALQERLARLIDEIRSADVEIDVNPLLDISKQLSSNAIEHHKE